MEIEEVKKMLTEMQKYQHIPKDAFKFADELSDSELESMNCSDAADMCISLAMLK